VFRIDPYVQPYHEIYVQYHGKEIDEKERGHYDSMNQVVQDAFEIAQTLYDSEKGLPYIVLGHSMGSITAGIPFHLGYCPVPVNINPLAKFG
jgi:surfactin synthase thioesterase subunit